MVNSLICDKLTSITAAQTICSALVARERTGVGQRVDIAMLEAALYFLWSDNMLNWTFVGDDVEPMEIGNSHERFVRKTADGYVCTMPVQLDEWLGVFKTLDLPNLIEDERFQAPGALQSDLFQETLNEAYAKFTTEELLVRLEENQVPFAQINARHEVVDDPQIKAMESLWEFDHPWAGPMRQARPPGRFSETPAEIFRCSPELGEHTREVLAESGFTEEQIKDLRARQVVR